MQCGNLSGGGAGGMHVAVDGMQAINITAENDVPNPSIQLTFLCLLSGSHWNKIFSPWTLWFFDLLLLVPHGIVFPF